MTWVVPLALGGVAILLMVVFTVLSARKRHRAASASAAPAGPRILLHDINDDRCTGCDACVSVCPTNVLDLVENKSRVLRFQDCIQCEACMFACPTEALVMFPEGSTPPALKVPEIDENFQTAVPGQYLIGEVAGKPLVKSAANLGRAVIEHMLQNGLRPGALGGGETQVDVAIIGSGPGGLSAALTCRQKGLSYVVLEKEQMIASTISRYPKGKLVMAEPYDTQNLSFLPVFDSAKEQLIPVWRELLDRVGIKIKQGESVETVSRGGDGNFDVRTTVAAYRAQRVVLSIGTRGKPRTLQVPGENLPKVYNLLEDPDEWRGKSVLVVGGGDSACEAALALADAGAKVIISYRGKGFNRAAPKNKQAIDNYANEGRIKPKLGSQVVSFDAESVTLALSDGSQKQYPNDGAFVLIGADPPVQFLEKLGVKFVERPHQYQLGKTDDIVRRFVPRAVECPEDAARAAAQVLGGSVGVDLPRQAASVALPVPLGEPISVSGPRKWLRSATSIFSSGRSTGASGMMAMPSPPAKPAAREPRAEPREVRPAQRSKKFDAPVPLSEFAKRGKTNGHMHNGSGRRDALSAGERTRILRMLRDEGGRLADEESQVSIGAAPPARDYDFEFEDDSAPAPPPPPQPQVARPDIPAKPAVVFGLAQAQARSVAKRTSDKMAAQRVSAAQAAQPVPEPRPMPAATPPRSRGMNASAVPAPPRTARQAGSVPPPAGTPPSMTAPARRAAPVPRVFGEEPTRQVDDELLTALRNAPPAKPPPRSNAPPRSNVPPRSNARPKPTLPPPNPVRAAAPDDPTRLADISALGFDDGINHDLDDMTRPADDFMSRRRPADRGGYDDARDLEDSTRLASVDGMAAMERARTQNPSNDERTRAVNIRNDPSISDIDWDLD